MPACRNCRTERAAKRKSNERERAAGGKGACVRRAEPGPERDDPAQETAKKNGAGEQDRRLHHHIGIVLHVLPPPPKMRESIVFRRLRTMRKGRHSLSQ